MIIIIWKMINKLIYLKRFNIIYYDYLKSD